MAKHFPGGGPQPDGEDPHFPYGREQVYPGGVSTIICPVPPGDRGRHLGPDAVLRHAGRSDLDGAAIEEVGFGFNGRILTGLLREGLGFEGVICTDWGLITGTVVLGRPLPARAWGVEHLGEHDRW